MNISPPSIMVFGAMSVLISCCAPSNSEDGNNGEKYARSRITIDGEKEWSEVKAHPGKYHIPISRPNHPAFDDLSIMNDCVQSFVKEGNVSGIRGAFLMAYIGASTPHRSGDVMASYAEPLCELRNRLGDEKFAASLSKMRTEVQSAVFYIMNFCHWPAPGAEKEWDDRFKSEYPKTFILNNNVKRIKWPHDYEK